MPGAYWVIGSHGEGQTCLPVPLGVRLQGRLLTGKRGSSKRNPRKEGAR